MQDIIALTETLIRYQTMVHRPQEIMACTDFICSWLTDENIRYERLEQNGIPSVLVTPTPGNAPVLLMSHLDVVAADEDLFIPRIRDGRLWGRGAADDKYAAALSLVLLRERLSSLRSQGKDQEDLEFGILITGDEETGGFDGAGFALTRVKCDYCIAIDGGDTGRIVEKEKGVAKVRLQARGKAAHGARPWMGENAILNLMEDLGAVRDLFSESTEDHWHKTLNIGIIKAGQSHNQVPDSAEAVLDIRYTEQDDIQAVFAAIQKAAVHSKMIIETCEPLFHAGTSPYHDLMARTVPEVKWVAEHGASDARFLSDKGVPGIVWGADSEGSIHSETEHVVIASVFTLYEHLNRFFDAVAKADL